jgi:hypothetical protein
MTATETPAGTMRRAAREMRAEGGWVWAVADWLDAATAVAERTEAEGAFVHPDSYALKVARAYLGETPATTGATP